MAGEPAEDSEPLPLLEEASGWQAIRKAAFAAWEQKAVFASPQRGQRYQVEAVSDLVIQLARLDANASETLKPGEVRRAIRRLNAAGGRVPRRTLHYTVAKETAIVFLHPRLDWDTTRDFIQVVPQEKHP